jgi:orotidine-5'-phosphate decarboxylase
VTASRSIVRAHEQPGAPGGAAAAARAEAQRLRDAAWALG